MDDKEFTSGQMDQGQEQSQGGYCIEIYVGVDGKPTSVNVESMDEEGAEGQGMGMQAQGDDSGDMGGEGQDDDKGVPVASLEDAMSMVKEIIQNQGQMPQGGGNDREAIARKVFGDQIVNNQMPGELNRKGRSGY